MKIIVINPILFTHEKGVIPHVTTIKETMIYDFVIRKRGWICRSGIRNIPD